MIYYFYHAMQEVDMRTLILNGSPHCQGDTAFLIEEWKKKIPSEYYMVSAYQQKIEPCNDCRQCFVTKGCVKKDAMVNIYREWLLSECILIASPIYFSQLTGPLLAMASRFQSIWAAQQFLEKEPLPKKHGIIILTGGGQGRAAPALAGARAILSVLGAEVEGEILSLHTDSLPSREDTLALQQLDVCAKKFLKNTLR